jgi:hypothetical protein
MCLASTLWLAETTVCNRLLSERDRWMHLPGSATGIGPYGTDRSSDKARAPWSSPAIMSSAPFSSTTGRVSSDAAMESSLATSKTSSSGSRRAGGATKSPTAVRRKPRQRSCCPAGGPTRRARGGHLRRRCRQTRTDKKSARRSVPEMPVFGRGVGRDRPSAAG